MMTPSVNLNRAYKGIQQRLLVFLERPLTCPDENGCQFQVLFFLPPCGAGWVPGNKVLPVTLRQAGNYNQQNPPVQKRCQ